MIYDYGLYYDIFYYLENNLPVNSIRKVSSLAEVERFAQSGDLVIFFGWGKGNQEGQRRLLDKGVTLMEDGEVSLKLGNRLEHLKFADTLTKFPLKRLLLENEGKRVRQHKVPDLYNGENVVIKIGNSHQGKDKYLKNPGFYFSTPENVVFEQFVPNARSIRVLLIDKSIFIVEHVNAQHDWLGNIRHEEVLYTYEGRAALCIPNIDAIIEDALIIAKAYNMDYAGVDYAVNTEITGFLEMNDMIGLPDDEYIHRIAREYWLKVCKEHLGLK